MSKHIDIDVAFIKALLLRAGISVDPTEIVGKQVLIFPFRVGKGTTSEVLISRIVSVYFKIRDDTEEESSDGVCFMLEDGLCLRWLDDKTHKNVFGVYNGKEEHPFTTRKPLKKGFDLQRRTVCVSIQSF